MELKSQAGTLARGTTDKTVASLGFEKKLNCLISFRLENDVPTVSK